MRLLSALCFAALLASGCGAGTTAEKKIIPGPCDGPLTGAGDAPGGGAAAPFVPTAVSVFRVGEQPSVTFVDFERPADKCQVAETFKEARVEVFDPRNERIAPTVTVARGDGGRITVTIAFTPATPGWYHVQAVLDFGSRTPVPQQEVLVAASRLDATRFELPLACSAVHRTASGALLCDNKLFRDGAVAQELPSSVELAVSGSVVWAFDAGSVSRYEDTGAGALKRVPDLALSTAFSAPYALLAREDELVLVARTGVGRYRVDGAALAAQTDATLGAESVYVDSRARVLALRAQDVVHVLVPTAFSAAKVCSFQLAAGGISRLGTACTPIAGFGAGASDEGFFVQDGTQVRALAPTAGMPSRGRGTLPSGYEFSFGSVAKTSQAGLRVSEAVRNFNGQNLPPHNPWTLPKVAGAEIVYEQFSEGSEYEFLGATATLAWERSKTLPIKTRIYVR